MSPGFRFPPFPLAIVEENAAPKISAEAEPETSTDIFEPPSPEYKRVYERLSQPSADILTQVFRSLPEMLPEPETDSMSIFEDKSHIDYAASSFAPALPISSTQSLEILVAERNYEQALRVLDELVEFGTEIPFSYSYEEAAMFAIKTPAHTQAEIEDQVHRFKKWFSLIPTANQSRPRTFRRLRRRIMSTPLTSLRLIMEFGLITAEKGFANTTHHSVIRVVAMYGNPDVTIQFIDELRRRNRTFLEGSSKSANADIMDRKLHVDIVGVAVKALANAGHFDHAVQLLPDPLETTFHLTHYTYSLLIRKLRKTRDARYLPHLKFLEEHKSEARLRNDTPAPPPSPERVAKLRANSETEAARRMEDFTAEDIHLASSFVSRAPQRVRNLAAALHTLKKGFRSISPSHRPHPLTVVRFFELYLGSGRTRAIPLLRNFVLRGTFGIHSYIFAEMVFHERSRNPDLVIQTFVTHFYLVGVPRDELLKRLDVMERDPETAYIWAAEPLQKLHPSPAVAALVWRALLEVTREERGLTDLYAKLLRFGDLRAERLSALYPGVPLLRPPPRWKTGVDPAAFTPFVRRICQAFGAERGALILKDMLDLGIKPTIHQLTELAMEYSRTGDVAKTFRVLDQARPHGVDPDSNVDDEVSPRRSAVRSHLIPRVDQVFYIAIIRGFLLSNQLAAAKEVERRMHERYGHVDGNDPHLDELYEDLMTAERGEEIPLRSVRALLSYILPCFVD
ncbi:hypothetical protein FB451DRAFT_1027530 [Mycena latifolia]|nr:hypothetical protein FB451DRAFT_1027530 [Mycena latifolia]